MIVKIEHNPNGTLCILGKKAVVNKKYYGMTLQGRRETKTIPSNIQIIPMDERYVEKCDGMNYMVKHYYDKEKDKGFKGGVLLCDGQIGGYICGSPTLPVFWKDREKYNSSFYIKYVFVDAKYRGNHYAHHLVDYIVHSDSYDLFCLMVRKNDLNAIASYEHIGFTKAFLREFLFLPLIKKNLTYYYIEYK